MKRSNRSLVALAAVGSLVIVPATAQGETEGLEAWRVEIGQGQRADVRWVGHGSASSETNRYGREPIVIMGGPNGAESPRLGTTVRVEPNPPGTVDTPHTPPVAPVGGNAPLNNPYTENGPSATYPYPNDVGNDPRDFQIQHLVDRVNRNNASNMADREPIYGYPSVLGQDVRDTDDPTQIARVGFLLQQQAPAVNVGDAASVGGGTAVIAAVTPTQVCGDAADIERWRAWAEEEREFARQWREIAEQRRRYARDSRSYSEEWNAAAAEAEALAEGFDRSADAYDDRADQAGQPPANDVTGEPGDCEPPAVNDGGTDTAGASTPASNGTPSSPEPPAGDPAPPASTPQTGGTSVAGTDPGESSDDPTGSSTGPDTSAPADPSGNAVVALVEATGADAAANSPNPTTGVLGTLLKGWLDLKRIIGFGEKAQEVVDRSGEEIADEEEMVDTITAGRPDYTGMTMEERIQARREAEQTFRDEVGGRGTRWRHTRNRAVELIEAGR